MSIAESTSTSNFIGDHRTRTFADGAPLYFRLLSYVKPYWVVFAAGILAMVCVGVVESYMPTLLQPLLDGAFVEKDVEVITTMPLILVGIALLRGIANFAAHVGLLWVAGRVVMDLRQEMFGRILTMPTRQFDNMSTGVLLSKVTFDVHRVMDACTHALIVLIRDTVMVLGLLSWMLYLHWQLTLIVFAIVPVIVVVVRIVSKRLRRINLSMQDAMGQTTRILEEAITGHKLVKVFAGQPYESGRFNNTSNWVRRYEVKVQITSQINIFISHTLIALALALIVYIATTTPFGMEPISVGTFAAIFAAMGMLSTPVKRLTKTNEQLQQGLAAAQSVFELIDKLPEQDEGGHAVQRLQGQVKFQHINFAYPDNEEKALNDINLDIEPGKTIALVGASGSGKTTLANLIPRFYPLEHGQLLIDGVDIREMPLAQLRENIALVSQEVVLFNDTIAANIAYGAMSGASREAIAAAAKAAHAMDFIETLPDGLDTIIGERGAKLSGGQRQR
ncbi:MAG: ABC transporter transmembrane domain-containing protein, partial [Pseudomonadota bacterium]